MAISVKMEIQEWDCEDWIPVTAGMSALLPYRQIQDPLLI
jgi:hypothetical protein